MRNYNVISILKEKNPNIVNTLTMFNNNVAVVQFNPNRGCNCIRTIYNNGEATIMDGIYIKSTYRYKPQGLTVVDNSGDNAIIVSKQGLIVLDIKNDIIKIIPKQKS